MAFTPGPGMVTSGLVGSTYQNMTPQAEAYYYKELDRKREERERRNAEIRAQRQAEQQARQSAEDRERVQAAFNQTYGPQLQRAFQENAVLSAPTNSPAGKARDFAIGHGYTSGSKIGQPGTDFYDYAAKNLPQPTMAQPQIQKTLDWMWRQQTDPYQRTANQMNMMRMFYPTGGMGSGGGRIGGSGRRRKITTNEQEEQPGGMDWQKASRPGPSGYPLGERLK